MDSPPHLDVNVSSRSRMELCRLRMIAQCPLFGFLAHGGPPPRRRIASSGCPHRSGEFVKVAKSNHCPLHDRINRSIGRDAIWNSGINTIGFEGLGSSTALTGELFPPMLARGGGCSRLASPFSRSDPPYLMSISRVSHNWATVEAIGADNFIGRKGIEVGLCTIVLLAAWLALAPKSRALGQCA